MKIGILGAGNIGGALGRYWARAGHSVFLSSRHPSGLQGLVREIGNGARAGTLEEAARFGDVVVLAIPWWSRETIPRPDLLRGKVVIDPMNPYSAQGEVMDMGDGRTSSEEVAKLLPGARLVKAFNTMSSDDLRSGAFRSGGDRWAMFLAGDDSAAKRIVSRLIEDIGFVPIDTGSLEKGGRLQRPGSPIYVEPLTAKRARAILRSLD